MNKTTNIHIKGVPFILEENAYSSLQDYLKRLKISLGNQQGAEEIAEDIELRIAELLSEITKNNISVIEERHIQEVISILGDPREYATDDSEQVQPEEESAQAVNGTIPVGRSLFRDKENAWLGGVCAGIAAYLNINVLLIRLALILFILMGGSGFLIYLILWIILPRPKSTLDYLRMRGAPINIQSIKDQFAKTTSTFSQNAQDAAEEMSEKAQRMGDSLKNNAQLDRVGKNIARVLRIVVGLILLGMGISMLIGIVTVFISDSTIVYNDNQLFSTLGISDLIFPSDSIKHLAWISFIAVFGSITVFILIGALTTILNLSMKFWKVIALSLFSIGLIGVIIGIYATVTTVKDYSTGIDVVENVQGLRTDTLHLSIEQYDEELSNGRKIKARNNHHIYNAKGDYLIDKGYHIRYEESKDSLFHIEINRSSQGANEQDATKRANNIQFDYQINDQKVVLPNHYKFPKKDKIRGQRLKLTVYIPQQKEVIIGSDTISFKRPATEVVEVIRSKSGSVNSDGTYSNY